MTADPQAKEDVLRAIRHPLRRRILKEFDLSATPLAPSELASALGVSVSSIGHHMTVLGETGLIELLAEEPVRGTVKHIYGPTERFSHPLITLALEEGKD